MRKTTFFHHKQPFLTRQDIIHTIVLIALALLFGLMPKYGLGQSMPGQSSFPAFDASLDSAFPTPLVAASVESAPAVIAPTALTQQTSDILISDAATVSPAVEQFYRPQSSEAPTPVSASASPLTASPYQPPQSLRQTLSQTLPQATQHEVIDIAVNVDHPFQQYLGMPNSPQSKITGKPMTVAELLSGTRSSSARCQLLQAYWELSGLLTIYHFRCESERLASGTVGTENMQTLLQEQCRTAELEFIKQQCVLAELLKQYKGQAIRESVMPIPADYPLYPRYRTFADRIARSERTQYLGRMIPIQEQLIESKASTWKAVSEMPQSETQPFFVLSTQRTATFLDLTKTMIDYNKMIAEYATETIPPNINPQQLVSAVVRLPERDVTSMQPQTLPEIAQAGYEY